jgi:CRISPR-associated protein Csy3
MMSDFEKAFQKAVETNKSLTNLPTILSFTRNLEPSDGLMYSGKWENIGQENEQIALKTKPQSLEVTVGDKVESIELAMIGNYQNKWRKIKLSERKNLGTKSHYSSTEKDHREGNPVEGDKASLYDNDDTLKLSFMLKILGNVGEPTACNEPSYAKTLVERYEWIKAKNGLSELAKRYAYNIANARFLFRNRVNAQQIEVYVKKAEKTLKFNAYDFSLNNFDKNEDNQELIELAQWIEAGLNDNGDGFTLLEITAYANMGNRSQIYPSQEMNTAEKRKTLFQLEGCAGIHDVKLGNAIRTIDTWYPDKDKYRSIPFAIEPFGSIVQKGDATRDGNGADLYTYLKKITTKKISDNIDDNDLFFVANLIRGGLFQGEKTSK